MSTYFRTVQTVTMKILGKFEIHDIFSINVGIALAGRLISGGPISNEKDILQKEIYITFSYNQNEISKKIIRLDGWFGTKGLDIIIEVNDNIALLIQSDNETQILNGVKLSEPIMGEISTK